MRRLFNALAIVAAILFVAECELWIRSLTGQDRAGWIYCRYLPDRSIASDELYVTSDRRGVELLIMRGHAPPSNGNLVRGYDLNADLTGGRPRFSFGHETYAAMENWQPMSRRY